MKVVQVLLAFLLLSIFTGCSSYILSAQNLNYRQIYGKDWIKADQWVSDNKSWMQKECRLFRVDYNMAVSVVFPELIRYSALRDKIEITLLKALYTHKGAEYSDFSVGFFQMKPSCAEAILDELVISADRKSNHFFNRLHHNLSGKDKRRVILAELEDPESAFIYVLAMLRLLDIKYENAIWKNADERIMFFATAYNSGFRNNEITIRKKMKQDSFYTGLIKPDHCYSYGAISLLFYKIISKLPVIY
jgi:hypothetical protein